MRARSRPVQDSFTRRHTLSHFGGVLAGFRYQGLITQTEEESWSHKMTAALGWSLPELPPTGNAHFVRLEGDDLPPAREMDLDEPTVVRSLSSSPEVTAEYLGSTFRVTGVDICDARVIVRWSVSPEPDVALLFPEDFNALEAELGGVDEEWAANELRTNTRAAFIRGKTYVFQLTDDVGTQYERTRHMGLYDSQVATGAVTFKPSVPDVASELIVTWHQASSTIPLG